MGGASRQHGLDGDDGDDLARQRRKRAARQLVDAADPHAEVTLRDVVVAAVAALDESGGRVDVRRYLSSRGHPSTVVDAVVAYLEKEGAHPSSHLFDGGVPT